MDRPGVLAVWLAVGGLAAAQPPQGPTPKSDGREPKAGAYTVTYSCPDWRATEPMEAAAAVRLARYLGELGAEVRRAGAGVAADDPTFPVLVLRLEKVLYRLPLAMQLTYPNEAGARELGRFLRGLGFRVNEPAAAPGPAAELPLPSGWVGTVYQEQTALSARLDLWKVGDVVTGELAFTHDGRSYRARLGGTVRGDEVTLTSYEVLEGRVYTPVTYQGRLREARLNGVWEYAPLGLSGEFQFARDR
jgi:hypothetical protein